MISITIATPWYGAHELGPAYQRAVGVIRECDKVIVIDNGGAPEIIGARTLSPGRNLGFSRACNLALNVADTDALLWLNDDIRMTSPDWLWAIKEELAPGVLVGAELSAPPYSMVDGCHIPYLAGWCLAGMTDDLRSLGGFDETFEEPAYFGDNDLCLRARRAGMRLVAAPVGLKHLGNVTSRSMDVSGVSARNYDRYAARARELLAVV